MRIPSPVLISSRWKKQQECRRDIFRECHFEITKDDFFYLTTLQQIQDEAFIARMKAELSRSSLGRKAVEWLKKHKTEIILWDETERSKHYKCHTLAYVHPAQPNKMNIIRRKGILGEHYAITVAHEFRHLIEDILAPEIKEATKNPQPGEQGAVDRFIATRLVEAVAYAFHGLVGNELNIPNYEMPEKAFMVRFFYHLDSDLLLEQYDPTLMNYDFLRVINEGRLMTMVKSSSLSNLDVAGSLLRLDETEKNPLKSGKELDELLNRMMIWDKLANVKVPLALMESYNLYGGPAIRESVETNTPTRSKVLAPS